MILSCQAELPEKVDYMAYVFLVLHMTKTQI